MAATTTSPVKILLDLGYEIWEMEKDGYRSALMESINDLTRINPRDGRIAILIQALKNLKRAPDKPKINISKVLNKRITGADIKPADIDDSTSTTSSALVPDRLNNVADSLDSIALLLRRQLGLEKKQQRDTKKQQDKINKDAREDKLEGKPKDKKTGLIPNAIKKPALNFFEKLKTFFLNVVIGAGVIKLFEWLKDPANTEKIIKFKDFLINNAALILGGLAAIALLPVLGGIMGVLGALKGGLLLLKPALGLLFSPAGLSALALALGIGGTLFAMKFGYDKIRDFATGGKAFTAAHEALDNKLQQDIPGFKMVGDKPFVFTGSDKQRKQGKGPRRELTKEEMVKYNEVVKERERLNKIHTDMDTSVEKAIAEAEPDAKRTGRNKGEYVSPRKQAEIRKKIEADYIKKITSEAGATPAPALIDQKNLETNIPGPRTAPKLNRVTGDPGQRTPPQMYGGGGGGEDSASEVMISTEDINNPDIISTSSTYGTGG